MCLPYIKLTVQGMQQLDASVKATPSHSVFAKLLHPSAANIYRGLFPVSVNNERSSVDKNNVAVMCRNRILFHCVISEPLLIKDRAQTSHINAANIESMSSHFSPALIQKFRDTALLTQCRVQYANSKLHVG